MTSTERIDSSGDSPPPHKRPNPYTHNDAPRKARKVRSGEKSAYDALLDVAKCLRDSENHKILVDHLTTIPDGLQQIINFRDTFRASIIAANPIDLEGILKTFRATVKYPEDAEFRDSSVEIEAGWEAADRMVETIKNELLWKLYKTDTYEMKVECISTLVIIMDETVGIPSRDMSEWSDGFRSGEFPEAISAALKEIGELLSDAELRRFAPENESILSTIDSAYNFVLYGSRPWESLADFMTLVSESVPLKSTSDKEAEEVMESG